MDPNWGSEEELRRQQQEEEEEDAQPQYPSTQNNNNDVVMTEEQIEELRKQIVAYVVISEQLAQMYKTLSANHYFATGMRNYEQLLGLGLGSSSVGQKMRGSRQRWTPTPVQLEMLERMYDEKGTPTKQKIKDITAQLAQHGPISETNVYNWFQNRRARSKKKSHLHQQQPQHPKPSASASKPNSTNIAAQSNAANDKTVTTQGVDQTFYLQNPDTGLEERTGNVESSPSCDSYSNLAEQYGLPG